MIQEATNQKLAYSVDEAAKLIGISKTSLRMQIYDGKLKAKKFGQRILILGSDLKDFLANQEDWTNWKKNKSEK